MIDLRFGNDYLRNGVVVDVADGQARLVIPVLGEGKVVPVELAVVVLVPTLVRDDIETSVAREIGEGRPVPVKTVG